MAEFGQLDRTFRSATERLGLRTGNPLREFFDGLLPVVQVATAMYSDVEEPLFWGSAPVTPTSGSRRGAQILRCVVPTLLVSLLPNAGGIVRSWTEKSSALYLTNSTEQRRAQVTPTGRESKNTIESGTSAAQPASEKRDLTFTVGLFNPILLGAPMVVAAGQDLIIQGVNVSTNVGVAWQWRELE